MLLSVTLVGSTLPIANYDQDHMVFQGESDTSNAPVLLTMTDKISCIRSSSSSANSLDESTWSVTLDGQTEEGAFQVKVIDPLANGILESITLNDVLFGGAWACSG